MDGAVVESTKSKPAEAGGVHGQQLPLTFVSAGETVRILKVRGKSDLTHHLENLGFVEGADVKIVSGIAGDLVVEVKGAQVAISRQAATHIITTAAN